MHSSKKKTNDSDIVNSISSGVCFEIIELLLLYLHNNNDIELCKSGHAPSPPQTTYASHAFSSAQLGHTSPTAVMGREGSTLAALCAGATAGVGREACMLVCFYSLPVN